MANRLHIDIETYSSVDIKSSGVYKYCESVDFEILLVAYAFNDDDIKIVDLAQNERLPDAFLKALSDPEIEKHAHNANFERNCFRAIGYDVPIKQWFCTQIKSAYCGLPVSLEMVSSALELNDKGKLATGKALIRYFCIPCKSTKANGERLRNMPADNIDKWNEFKNYCIGDVIAEREIHRILKAYIIPETERQNYILDQEINDRGILVDQTLASNAVKIDNKQAKELRRILTNITNLENPNSSTQLKQWLSSFMHKEVKSLAKNDIDTLIDEAESDAVKTVLKLRKKASKTSTKKYNAFLNCVCYSGRVHGLLQFYGANRTGRWAGRLVQLQNLPQNKLPQKPVDELDQARKAVAAGDYELISMLHDDVSSVLSQLIRTTMVAKDGHTFAVADFSAIEARVIAWLADEKWRLEVFRTHGKIYEASASMMFGVPLEQITKELRSKGKVAELALGYQGAIGALKQMGGEAMGLSDTEMETIVTKWRSKNPSIVKLWAVVERAAVKAIATPNYKIDIPHLSFKYDGTVLTIELPSGRKLFYQKPILSKNKWGRVSIKYKGLDQVTKKWWYIDTYGGKLVENIIQAIARDILADAMLRINDRGFDIVLHVHDEVACEVPIEASYILLNTICDIMGEDISWAKGLPLTADGYVTIYYKKD